MTRGLRIICSAMFFWGLGEGLFIYFQPIYLDQLGADPIQIGGMLGLAGLAYTVSHIPAGALSDTIGRKYIIVLAWFVGVFSSLIMYLATSLSVFMFGFILYSFTGFVMAALQSYITTAKGSWTVTRALTMTSAFGGIGAIIGPVVGGQLAELFGLKAIYAIATGVFLLSATQILFLRPQPVESADDGPRYQNLFRNKTLAGFLLLVFIVLFGMYLSWPLTPIFLQEVRGVTVGSLGLFGSINALGVVILSLILGRLNPRFGFVIAQLILSLILGRLNPRFGFVIAQRAVGFSILLIWRGTNPVWLSFGYFLAAGFRTSRSLILAQVENLVSRVELGLAYGLAETINGSVMMIASPIAGVLYDIGEELPYMVSIGVIAIALASTLRFIPRKQFARSNTETSINQDL